MLAARWADDVRKQDGGTIAAMALFLFKPAGERVVTRAPAPKNILTALEENQRILRSESGDERSHWLGSFTSSATVHQPLHTAQLFTRGLRIVTAAALKCWCAG